MKERKLPQGRVSVYRLLSEVGIDRPTMFRKVRPALEQTITAVRGTVSSLEAEMIKNTVTRLREKGELRPRRKSL